MLGAHGNVGLLPTCWSTCARVTLFPRLTSINSLRLLTRLFNTLSLHYYQSHTPVTSEPIGSQANYYDVTVYRLSLMDVSLHFTWPCINGSRSSCVPLFLFRNLEIQVSLLSQTKCLYVSVSKGSQSIGSVFMLLRRRLALK